jgi:hypothetical protein
MHPYSSQMPDVTLSPNAAAAGLNGAPLPAGVHVLFLTPYIDHTPGSPQYNWCAFRRSSICCDITLPHVHRLSCAFSTGPRHEPDHNHPRGSPGMQADQGPEERRPREDALDHRCGAPPLVRAPAVAPGCCRCTTAGRCSCRRLDVFTKGHHLGFLPLSLPAPTLMPYMQVHDPGGR